MLITQRVTEVVTEWNPIARQQVLDQHNSLSDEQKKIVFKTLIESGQFFEAAAVISTIQRSADIANLCVELNTAQRREISTPLVEEGFYNVAAELAESLDNSFKDYVYGEISLHAAEKNDIFLVTQFTGSMHDVSEKDRTLERAAKIIAEKGPHWIEIRDLKAITQLILGKESQGRIFAECKELVANRKV